MYKLFFFIKTAVFLLPLFNFSFGQEIPNEFFLYKRHNITLDAGLNWQTHSTFGPVRFQQLTYDQPNVKNSFINARYGFLTKNNKFSYYGFFHFNYQNNFYGYLYSRIVNDLNSFDRFTGKKHKISRFGFNAGEVDLSGVGYDDGKLIFQIGRGRQSIGAGNDIFLALSNNSPSYDYFLFGLDFGLFKMRSFNGFLESDSL